MQTTNELRANTNITKNLKKEIMLLTYGIILIGFIIYLIIISIANSSKEYMGMVYALNWVGIFSFVYVVLSWKKLTNRLFTPYLIFMSFFFIFQFGQPFMWAFGVHLPNEIGKQALYPGLSIPTSADILIAQSLVIISMLMFHFGAIISYKKIVEVEENSGANIIDIYDNFKYEDTRSLKSIFYVCCSIGLIAIPLQLFVSFRNLQIARIYGYKALYYSEFAPTGSSFYSIFLFMFFPCLLGILIGSKFDKKSRVFVYSVFGAYAMLNLLSGDRGSWLYKIVVLVWLSHTTYKPIKFRKIIKYIIIVIIVLYLINAVIAVRDIGITVENVRQSLSFKNSPIIAAFFEMGGSMKTIIVLQKYGWDIWPYANTYVLAIIGMITNRIFNLLGIQFKLLSSFFSQEYLGISWGAGFSIVAESLLNFGPIISPIFMIFLGWIITCLIEIDMNIDYKRYPLKYFFVTATLESLIGINRNVVHIPVKTWFYGTVLLYLIILFVRRFIFVKTSNV